MKEPTRRRSSRNSKQHAENTSPYVGRSRRSLANENVSQGRSTRTTSATEESSQRKRKRSISTSVERPKVPKKMADGTAIDTYCWVCHKPGGESICRSCPRVYHKDCLKKVKRNSNEPQVCDCCMKRVDGRNEDLDLQNLRLQILLQCVMQEAIKEKKNNQKSQKDHNNKFCEFFQSWPHENEKLCKIMDLDILIDKMNGETEYRSSGQFFLDVKWIYHNCCIVYGSDSDVTETALKLQKNFKMELTDMEACPECYACKYSDKYLHDAFFTNVCTNDHQLVWAQIRGSPHWPAKLMSIQNGHADVRFFGTHDKANILSKKCLKISLTPPLKKKASQMKLQEAVHELHAYVKNYEIIKKKKFIYYPADTPLEDYSASTKKHVWKNTQRTEDEKVSRKDNSSGTREPDSETRSIGTQEEPDSGTRSTESQEEHDSGTRYAGSGTPGDSSENLFLSDTKVKCISNFADNGNNQKRTDCLNSSNSREWFEMSFSAEPASEHPEPASELSNSDAGCLNDSSYSLSSFNQNFSLDSLNENPNLLPAASDLPSNEFSTSTEIEQDDFENVSAFNSVVSASETPLPIISCALSSNEILSNSVSADLKTLSKLPVITSARSVSEDYLVKIPHKNPLLMNDTHIDNSSSEFVGSSSVTSNDNTRYILDDDDDHEDDIEVINELISTASGRHFYKNKAILTALVEVLFGSKPRIKEQLKALNAFILHNFLIMWIEMCSTKFDGQELQAFGSTCIRYLSKISKLETVNSELVKEVNMLKDQIKDMEINLNKKAQLEVCIIEKAAGKMEKDRRKKVEAIHKTKVKQLETEVDELKMELDNAKQVIKCKDEELMELTEKCERLEKQYKDDIKSQTEESRPESCKREIHMSDSTSTFFRLETPIEAAAATCEQTYVQKNEVCIVESMSFSETSVIQQGNVSVPDCRVLPSNAMVICPAVISPAVISYPNQQQQQPNFLDGDESRDYLAHLNETKSKSTSDKTSGKRKKKT